MTPLYFWRKHQSILFQFCVVRIIYGLCPLSMENERVSIISGKKECDLHTTLPCTKHPQFLDQTDQVAHIPAIRAVLP